jgi:multisubunit Na+/H+ antiporter MnhC subunit
MIGPQIAFAGALAAIAYAAKKDYMDSNWAYHDAKNIFRPFSPHQLDVVVVGGLFGALGYLLTFGLATVSAPVDPIAGSIVLTAIVHRLVLGYDLLGRPAGENLFDMSPFEREETIATDGGAGEPAERLSVEVWLPWMYQWKGLTFLGIVAGMMGAFTFYATGSPLLVFGISGLAFLILNDGMEDNYGELRFPIAIQHHMTVPASLAAFAFSGVPLAEATAQTVAAAIPLWQALAIGAIFGLLGSLLGEVAERLVYAHGDTHFDPPACAIALTTVVIGVLAIVGVFPSGGLVPVP